MKSFIKEFKEFALKGNVMDLAVGMIIGGAFTAIITAFIDDIINPIIGMFGGTDFSSMFVSLNGEEYASLAAAEEAGAAVLKYGAFISAVLNFLIMALVIFLIVKAMNKLREKTQKPEEEAAPTTKTCPYCKSEIAIEATRCPNCSSLLTEEAAAAVDEALAAADEA